MPMEKSVKMAGPSRAPTMNLMHSATVMNRVDPLKHIFRAIFEVLPSGSRGHVVATIGEFLGTLVFLVLAFGGVEAGTSATNDPKKPQTTKPAAMSPALLLYIALCAGFSLVVTAWTFFRISGGLFNPVISFGMALIGAITWFRCLLLIIAQTVATITAVYVVKALFNGGLSIAVGLGGSTSPAQGLVIEMILTAQLAFVIFMLAAEEHEATHLAPVGIGLSLFLAELVGVYWTGCGVNPIRALAPCIANREFPSYHWIYWVGPIAGVLLAVITFKLVKALEYESAQEQEAEDRYALKRFENSQKRSSVAPMDGACASMPKRETIKIPEPSKQQSEAPQPVSAPAPALATAPVPSVAQSAPQAVASVTPVTPSANLAAPPTEKKKVAALPECYAD